MQNEVEPSIIAHGRNEGPKPPGWKRPFLETPSAQREPIAELIERTVEFPEKDESTGELLINYMGPHNDNFVDSKARMLCPCFDFTHIIAQALDILASYLTSSPTAPLNKEFIEIESPLWCVLLTPI